MIERIITFSIRNRAFVILAGIALAAFGIYAVYHTPVDAIPDLSENQVIVFTEWMGHSPREIEDQITYPLTLRLEGMSGTRVVRSSSDFNFSMISVIFEEGVDYHSARQQVAERLSEAANGGAASLPEGVVPNLAPDAPATGQIFWYTLEGGGYDLGRLRAIQDWYVKPQLSSVQGVAEVASVGGHPIEYQVEVDPNRLRTAGVTLPEVVQAISRCNSAVGGHVIHKGNAEYIVRGVGWLGHRSASTDSEFSPEQARRDLESVPIRQSGDGVIRVGDVAKATIGSQFRRGVLEKDGNEVTGGVVLMRYGENPLELTHRIRQKLQGLQVGLPVGVRVVPFYDRVPLIEGAIRTVTTTLLEAIITATVCVLLVLLHFRTSFIIALTLPLAALASFAVMLTLRRLGIADIQTNIMSLAGIAISIGVLVDASIVMAENVMHHLKNHFGEEPVRGDIRELVLPACLTVGRPIFFSVAIMLLSFLPVFALSGIEGKMFRPLAFTKSFALLAVAVFAITLVPALCTIFIKGRLRRETDSWLLRGVMEVYRPVLSYCLAKPTVLIWIISLTLLIGFAPLGSRLVSLGTLFLAIVVTASVANGWLQRSAVVLSLIVAALLADQFIQPLGREFMPPLDEGMVMDMPITVPRASVVQSTDDLKARDMIFCRFPEVDMVVGKAGRAETPTDPAPLDMIETMINFRPAEYWPKRKLRPEDARRHAQVVLQAMVDKSWIKAPADARARENLVEETVTAVMPAFDAQMREYAYQRNQEFTRDLGRRLARIALETMVGMIGQNSTLTRELGPSDITLLAEGLPADLASRLALESSLEDITTVAHDVARKLTQLKWTRPDADLFEYRPNVVFRAAIAVHTTLGGTAPNFFTHLQTKVLARRDAFWREHIAGISRDLASRAGQVYTRLVIEDFLTRCPITDDRIAKAINEIHRARAQVSSTRDHASGHHHGTRDAAAVLSIEPQPEINSLQEELSGRFTQNVFLWRKDRADLVGFGGELDKVMQMPGWTNVWTMPIQNRVDMLSTGVNTTLGVRVLGRKLDDVVRASEEIADLLKRLPGASDVVADPVRGKGYLQIEIDREKAAGYGINVGDVNDVIETALGGKLATTVFEGRERHPVRIRFPRAWRESEESVANIPIALPMAPRANDSAPVESGDGRSLLRQVPLSQVAAVRITEGPTSIKSDNGLLRNYVRLNVHDRDVADFVEEARHAVAERIQLPAGVYIEWTGQFEHEIHARTTLMLIVPLVIALIIFILYQTYHDLADTFLMVLAVPGALAGGVFFQWLFGYKLSVTVFVGYIACFGMATATGVIMLVYLREAVAKAGGLKDITLQQLKDAVMTGAVHRLRPKLLTEATIVIGLAPMLWANGTGAEIIKPMAAPVLGGILIADEVIDLLLPVLFYWVRRWRWEKLHRQAVAKVT